MIHDAGWSEKISPGMENIEHLSEWKTVLILLIQYFNYCFPQAMEDNGLQDIRREGEPPGQELPGGGKILPS